MDTTEPIDDEVDSASGSNDVDLSESSFDKEYKECIKEFEEFDKKNNKLKFVHCKLCVSMPNIVKLNSDNKKIAPLATESGCRYRREYILNHFQSRCHKACKMSINVPSSTKGSIEFHVNKADEKQIEHVKKLLFDVFVDAKKISPAAHNWPSRFVGAEAGRAFEYSNPEAPTISQYVNKPSHLELLSTIVRADKQNFQEKIRKSIASSIRIDGSVDRTQMDKIYIMLVLITEVGEKELVFLSVAEQTERGAKGLFDAVKKGIIDNCGEDLYYVIMKNVSSICTDGTNVNIGDKNGLWALFENEIQQIGSGSRLLKIWCSSHRTELVWSDVCKSHTIVDKVLNQLSSISSYFHKSGLRSNALKEVAKHHKLNILTLPKLFEIRWTEFSCTLVNNFLQSWQVLMHYFDANKETSAIEMGYFKFLSKIEILKAIAFIADLLHIFSRHHKTTQDNTLTIVSLMKHIRSLQNALTDLRDQHLLGGWEESLSNDVVHMNGKLTLKGFDLINTSDQRKAKKDDFDHIRNSIIDSTISRLSERFETDSSIFDIIEPFLNFEESADVRKTRDLFGIDLDLSSLQLQFREIVDQNIPVKLAGNMANIIKTLAKTPNYKEILTVLSRIQACTPHSSDVERCISVNNNLKTPLRNNISIETENKNLFVYFNLPALEEWNPRPAIKLFINEKNAEMFPM